MDKMKTIITVMIACQPFHLLAQSTELTCWTIKGEQMKLTIEDDSFKLPDSVAAIDLCGVEGVALDCSSANPNCLYYTDGATIVEGLPNANVVFDGICDGLLLTDDACFYCPMAFFATDAMLRYTPRSDDEETVFSQPCHETIVLPFDADIVIPADVNGPMPEGWLQVANYIGYDYNELIFYHTHAACLNANTPYLVTFAYGAYDTKILFCGQDVNVDETKTATAAQGPYNFSGITMSEDEQPDYYRYHRGNKNYFIHTGDGMPMEPFRCFIVSFDLDYHTGPQADGDSILEYTVVEEESDGMETRTKHDASPKYYDLMGRPIGHHQTGRGIKIAKGYKLIK